MPLTVSVSRVALASALALGCASPGAPDAGVERWFDAALVPCAKGAPAPQTIDAFLAHVGTLPPRPSLPCVVASLPRPLALVATRNTTSAQPAAGPGDPRVFILAGDLTYSVVGAGPGSALLELSERRGERLSLKAELHFPLPHPVTAEHAYAHLRYSDRLTSCGFCHLEEQLDSTQVGKAVSRALKPEASQLAPLSRLSDELRRCDPEAPSERCLLLAALVGFGPYGLGQFPEAWATFGGP